MSVEGWQLYSDVTKSVVILTSVFNTNTPLCLWYFKWIYNYNFLFINQWIRSALFWDITKSYRYFGTTVPSHLEKSIGPCKVGPKLRRKRWVTNYYFTRHKIPEERRSCLHCDGRLKATNK